MTDDFLLATLNRAAHAVREVLDHLEDWGPAGTRAHQYRSDLVADEAAVRVLVDAGLGVVSEESGSHHPDRAIQVVLDPVDGSTNASRSLPWYACQPVRRRRRRAPGRGRRQPGYRRSLQRGPGWGSDPQRQVHRPDHVHLDG